MQMIPLADLHPHPDNPRLVIREDVVEQIAAQINGTFDEAHALIVRPRAAGGYEIVSGHTRRLAAERAGLSEVPCWVREMSDEDAYMALALSNAQGELSPLEVGMHALHSGLSQRDYAERAGIAKTTLLHRWQAAAVAEACPTSGAAASERWVQLSAIHAAPRWLWRAMVAALVEHEWTVDATRKAVKALADVPEPPAWVDAEAVASRLLDGGMKPSDISALAGTVEKARAAISAAGMDAEAYISSLDAALAQSRPSVLSEVAAICQSVLDRQADMVRAARQAEIERQREQEAQAERSRRLRRFISLDEWNALTPEDRKAALSVVAAPGEAPSFNKQESADIEWAQWSWNPITGCLHDCSYCYARDIAQQKRMEKAYPNGFAPTLRPLHLLAPINSTPPKQAETDTRYRNVFTGSMADIFGRWVPAEWIEAVLAAAARAPQWNFLFLTKFPRRMAEFDIPANAWLGTSVDLQVRVANAEKAFAQVSAPVKWLSVEPMLEPLRFSRLDLFDWIVIGGASRSTRTPEWRPPFAWIHDLVRQARDANVRVYFKTNLLGNPSRLLELPFDAPIPRDETDLPEAFRYLGTARARETVPEAAE